jgi:calcineurin-like phosphoesterase
MEKMRMDKVVNQMRMNEPIEVVNFHGESAWENKQFKFQWR